MIVLIIVAVILLIMGVVIDAYSGRWLLFQSDGFYRHLADDLRLLERVIRWFYTLGGSARYI